MTTNPKAAPDPGPLGRELMRQAQLITELRRELDELAHGTTDLAADLFARLDEGNGDYRSSPQAWCWRDLGPAAADELMKQLTEWVAWVRSRYPLAKKIPPCWTEHPEVVEEMTALWLAWQHAYTEPNAPLNAPAEWHDHWLPGLLHRLARGPHALDCSTEHAPRPPSAYV